MNHFLNRYDAPKANAQANLAGISHYVDDSTLRFHKARVLDSGTQSCGIIFWLLESVASDPDGAERTFRGVIFAPDGTVIHRPEGWGFKTRTAASQDLTRALSELDIPGVVLETVQRMTHALSLDVEALSRTLADHNATTKR